MDLGLTRQFSPWGLCLNQWILWPWIKGWFLASRQSPLWVGYKVWAHCVFSPNSWAWLEVADQPQGPQPVSFGMSHLPWWPAKLTFLPTSACLQMTAGNNLGKDLVHVCCQLWHSHGVIKVTRERMSCSHHFLDEGFGGMQFQTVSLCPGTHSIDHSSFDTEICRPLCLLSVGTKGKACDIHSQY